MVLGCAGGFGNALFYDEVAVSCLGTTAIEVL